MPSEIFPANNLECLFIYFRKEISPLERPLSRKIFIFIIASCFISFNEPGAAQNKWKLKTKVIFNGFIYFVIEICNIL